MVETTPPSGYGAGTAVVGTAVATVGTSCTAPNKPTDANSATFTNPPLGEITVGYHDLGSGETSAAISCARGATTLTAQAAGDDDDINGGYLEAQAFTFNPVTPARTPARSSSTRSSNHQAGPGSPGPALAASSPSSSSSVSRVGNLPVAR